LCELLLEKDLETLIFCKHHRLADLSDFYRVKRGITKNKNDRSYFYKRFHEHTAQLVKCLNFTEKCKKFIYVRFRLNLSRDKLGNQYKVVFAGFPLESAGKQGGGGDGV
jgi:hypothetical protein